MYKMNEIINKFLLAENAFMTEILLKRPDFTYTAGGTFTKTKERIRKFEETGHSRYIY